MLDCEVEEAVPLPRRDLLDEGIECEARELEDGQKTRRIEAMPGLGKRQRDVDEVAERSALADSHACGQRVKAHALFFGQGHCAALQSVCHAKIQVEVARLGYRVNFVAC